MGPRLEWNIQKQAFSHGRPFSLALLLLCIAYLTWPGLTLHERGQALVFDLYQRWFPRTVTAHPVIIVDIDDRSLAAHGRWPWPRSKLAALVLKLHAAGALAIGLHLIMPEPDYEISNRFRYLDPKRREALSRLLAEIADEDQVLAEAMKLAPVILGTVGMVNATPQGPPELRTPYRIMGPDPDTTSPHFDQLQYNLPILEAAARGHGLLNVELDDDGVLRRLPLVGAVASGYAPSFVLELIRVAIDAHWFTVRRNERGITGVEVGNTVIPTDLEGQFRPYFSKSDSRRFVSAADVLSEKARFDESLFKNRIAIIGVSALGLNDVQSVPVTATMLGSEIHAQLVENIVADIFLHRPKSAVLMETGFVLLAGLALIVFVPILSPIIATGCFVVIGFGLVVASVYCFLSFQVLFDPLAPNVAVTIVFLTSLAGNLAETSRRRQKLAETLQKERLAAARLQGELDAAQAIQKSLLPPIDDTALPKGLRLAAYLAPARQVGGDLYHHLPLGRELYFLMIGDVSDKGVPAALYMALCTAVVKTEAQRQSAELAEIVNNTNVILAHDNEAYMFVTSVMMVVNCSTGHLNWCNMGHPSPIILRQDGSVHELCSVGGPPMAVLSDFSYETEKVQLATGDLVVLVTDGVTEAENGAGEFFGTDGLMTCLDDYATLITAQSGSNSILPSPTHLTAYIRKAVEQFRGDIDPNDDTAILVFQFNEPDRPRS